MTSTLTLRRGWSPLTWGSRCAAGVRFWVGKSQSERLLHASMLPAPATPYHCRSPSPLGANQAPTFVRPNPPAPAQHAHRPTHPTDNQQEPDIPPDVTAEEVGQQPANFKRNYRQVRRAAAAGVDALVAVPAVCISAWCSRRASPHPTPVAATNRPNNQTEAAMSDPPTALFSSPTHHPQPTQPPPPTPTPPHPTPTPEPHRPSAPTGCAASA